LPHKETIKLSFHLFTTLLSRRNINMKRERELNASFVFTLPHGICVEQNCTK
jgi:hypothetical protein